MSFRHRLTKAESNIVIDFLAALAVIVTIKSSGAKFYQFKEVSTNTLITGVDRLAYYVNENIDIDLSVSQIDRLFHSMVPEKFYSYQEKSVGEEFEIEHSTINKFKKPKYKCYNLYLAAMFNCSGIPYTTEIDTEENKVYFMFDHPVKCKELINKYWTNQLDFPPQKCFDAHRKMLGERTSKWRAANGR